MQDILVVRLQLSWSGVVEVRHSYFPITEEGPDRYFVDKISGSLPNLIDSSKGDVLKTSLDKPIYSEMYMKSENGSYWGFDAKVQMVVSDHNSDRIKFWEHSLCELAMEELRARNKRLKETFKLVESLTA